MAVVIRTTKDDYRIGIRVHFTNPHAEVSVAGHIVYHPLPGNPRAGNAIVVGLLQSEVPAGTSERFFRLLVPTPSVMLSPKK